MATNWNNEEKFREILDIEDPELKKIMQEEVFEENKGLAVYYASRYYRKGEAYEMDDLSQVALMALWEAISNFDVRKNTKFATYASLFIQGRIKNFFRDKNWNIYAPKKDKEILQKYNRSCEILKANGIEPTQQNLIEYTNLTEKEYEIATTLSGNKFTVDLNGYMSEDSKDFTNSGFCNSELIPSTDITMEDDVITKIILQEFLNKLSPEEETIFVEKYIKRRKNHYLKKTLNMSYSKINRIDEKLIRKFMKEIEDKD